MRTMLGGLAFSLACACPVLANDTTATLGTGGLVFVKNYDVNLISEDLFISTEEVRVKYEFRNDGKADQHVLVAFPMPDIEGSGDFMVGIPTEDPENIFGFTTTFNGAPVEATLHQYAFSAGIDQSAVLRELGVPLAPFGRTTQTAIDALGDEEKQRLLQLGLVLPMEYDSGQGMQTDYLPFWTLKSTYSWEADFPVGEVVEVEHRYKPSVGGTVAVTFLAEPYEGYDPRTEYTRKYCLDEAFISAVEKTLKDGEPYSAPFTETWLSYVWSTGANWSSTVGKFTLTVDKGEPENLVSFCGENVKKIGPTTFQMTATDWFPPFGRELDILILDRMEPVQ